MSKRWVSVIRKTKNVQSGSPVIDTTTTTKGFPFLSFPFLALLLTCFPKTQNHHIESLKERCTGLKFSQQNKRTKSVGNPPLDSSLTRRSNITLAASSSNPLPPPFFSFLQRHKHNALTRASPIAAPSFPCVFPGKAHWWSSPRSPTHGQMS